MNRQTVTFTALPNGVTSNGRLRLSVLIAPFFDSDGGEATLASFPDWLDWPSRALSFQAQFGTGDPVPATRVGPAPRSDLWTSLFGAGAQVDPMSAAIAAITPADTSDGEGSIFETYDTRFVHRWLKDTYAEFATTTPDEFPTIAQLFREGGPFRALATQFMNEFDYNPGHEGGGEDEGEGTGTSDGTSGAGAAGLAATTYAASADPDETEDAFGRLRQFHTAFSKTPWPKRAVGEVRFDVQQVLAVLGEYPAIARMLGLVYDLEVAHPANSDDTTVQVLATWASLMPAGDETVVIPRANGPRLATRCFIGPSRFYALPRQGGELAQDGSGMLPLNDTGRYELVEIDQDGAGIRALRFARALVRARVNRADDSPDRYSLPAMNSVGLAVARVGRGEVASDAIATAADRRTQALAGAEVTLDADDLVRGYAVDVWDDRSRKWRSLNERIGTYRFTDPKKPFTLAQVADEGWVSMAASRDPNPASTALAKMPETLFQWNGWSLAAPPPGKSVDPDGNVRRTTNEPGPQWPFAVDFVAAPGSLPRLRFGTRYRLRARAVDLAGNRVARAAADDTHATPPAVYGRFDPITSPDVVPQAPLTEGEAANHLVIRSNFNAAPKTPAHRHTLPPKAAAPMVEAHGVFDKSTGVVDTSGYGTIQARDGATIATIGKADPNAPGGYYLGGTSVSTPYLPDLLSRGAVLRGLPGATAPVRVSFGYSEGVKWPNATPFLIQLVEGSGAPKFDAGKRQLTVQLPKAEVASARISSYLTTGQGDVDRLGLVEWLKELGVDNTTLDTFKQQAADGTHWMVSPWRTLTFVHAVRQPLLRPRYVALTPTRELGQTFVTLTDATHELSRKSTVTLDIVAKWTETLDPLAQPGPMTATGNARPFQVQVPVAPTPTEETKLEIEGKHEFSDTKYRRVTYSAIATSRFGEYFGQRLRGVTLSGPIVLNPPVTDDGENLGGVIAGTEAVTTSNGNRTFQRGPDYAMDYLAGTLTPTGDLLGKTVDILFIAPPITRKVASPVTLDILNAARPDAPKVLYAIPTFGWTSSVNRDTTEFKSTRRGMGLRVYLDRPWFSSGDGERLGVVIWSGSAAPSEAEKAYVSDWALDPLYLSAATNDGPTVAAFKLADATRTTNLTLEEVPAATTLHVAGHRVDYDAVRKLWYADLEIDAGLTYMPFVRLALARYQPNSLTHAHLSRVVRADFVQLAPDRAVTMTRSRGSSRELNISVAGVGYTRAFKAPGRSVIEVSAERRRPNTDLTLAQELGWEEVPGSAVVLTPVAGAAAWTGRITLPAGSAGSFRVIVREIELFGTSRRPVYADAIVV